MPLQRQCDFIRAHAATIIGHLDQVEPACTQPDGDILCAGIDGVFDQFLQRTGRSFDHFTGCDPVDQCFGEPSY